MTKKEIKAKLKAQKIGTPTWGFSDSGTRFHVYRRPWSPRTLEERLQDAAQVQQFTGVCPFVDLHTAWDSSEQWDRVRKFVKSLGLQVGAVNPHLFADNDYVLGTICNPSAKIRRKSIDKLKEGVAIARAVGSSALSLWFPDGSDYPGQDSFRGRKERLEEALTEVYAAMPSSMSMLIEYKLFEPAFYHTDLADWGMAYLAATKLGSRAGVLVDLGHHALGANIEQITAVLLSEKKLGGFHFNDKKYGDDDLTVGSIQPYQLFLIFCELVDAARDRALAAHVRDIRLMIDENHNIKNQIEGTIQSVLALQTAYAKALMVDYAALARARATGNVIDAEECLKSAYETDVRSILADVRVDMGLDPDPLEAFRRSGYTQRMAKERGG